MHRQCTTRSFTVPDVVGVNCQGDPDGGRSGRIGGLELRGAGELRPRGYWGLQPEDEEEGQLTSNIDAEMKIAFKDESRSGRPQRIAGVGP